MTRVTKHAFAFVAALFVTIVSFDAVVTVTPATAAAQQTATLAV